MNQENCPHLRISASPTEIPYCADCGIKLSVDGFETLCEDAQELAVSALNGELNKRRLNWDNLQEIANWCSAADLYDTRVLLLIQSPYGEQIAQVGDTITKHPDGTFSVQNEKEHTTPRNEA